MLKRFNDGLARGEAALATGMLLLMLVVAFAQALLRNLTNYGVGWANAGLEWLDWADFIISKGTLWLAFLGASLAVHADKHINIDILPRMVSPKARIIMRGVSSIIASAICIALARAFWTVVLLNGEEIGSAYSVFDVGGVVHVCDAGAEALKDTGIARPSVFCGMRTFFSAMGVKLETPSAMFQLIVPVMFVFMCLRFLGQGIAELVRVARGDLHEAHAHGVAAVASDVAVDEKDEGNV